MGGRGYVFYNYQAACAVLYQVSRWNKMNEVLIIGNVSHFISSLKVNQTPMISNGGHSMSSFKGIISVVVWTKCLFTDQVPLYGPSAIFMDQVPFYEPSAILWTKCHVMDQMPLYGPSASPWTKCLFMDQVPFYGPSAIL
jgi:hypothetical protein